MGFVMKISTYFKHQITKNTHTAGHSIDGEPEDLPSSRYALRLRETSARRGESFNSSSPHTIEHPATWAFVSVSFSVCVTEILISPAKRETEATARPSAVAIRYIFSRTIFQQWKSFSPGSSFFVSFLVAHEVTSITRSPFLSRVAETFGEEYLSWRY